MEDMCTKNTEVIDVTLVHSDYSKKMKEICIFIYKGRAYLAENKDGSFCHHCLFRGKNACMHTIEVRDGIVEYNRGLCSFLAKNSLYNENEYNMNVNLSKFPGTKLINNYIPFEITRDLTSLFITSFIQRKIKSKV